MCKSAGQSPYERLPSAALPSPSFPQLPTKQQAVVRCFPGHVSPVAEGPGLLWRRAGLKQVRKGSGSGQRSDTIVRGCASAHSAPTLLHSSYPSPNLRTVLRRQISFSDKMCMNDICSQWGGIKDIFGCHLNIQCGKGLFMDFPGISKGPV